MKVIPFNAAPATFWSVRGMVESDDAQIVVESPTKAEAEAAGWRRGIRVVIVSQATPQEVRDAESRKQLYRFTPPPRLRCWGRTVSNNQAAMLVMCALVTILLDLRAWHIPMHF